MQPSLQAPAFGFVVSQCFGTTAHMEYYLHGMHEMQVYYSIFARIRNVVIANLTPIQGATYLRTYLPADL